MSCWAFEKRSLNAHKTPENHEKRKAKESHLKSRQKIIDFSEMHYGWVENLESFPDNSLI